MGAVRWNELELRFRSGESAHRAYLETGISYRTCWLAWKKFRAAKALR
jgi:hypothetical protein